MLSITSEKYFFTLLYELTVHNRKVMMENLLNNIVITNKFSMTIKATSKEHFFIWMPGHTCEHRLVIVVEISVLIFFQIYMT